MEALDNTAWVIAFTAMLVLACCRIYDLEQVSGYCVRQRRFGFQICQKVPNDCMVMTGGMYTVRNILSRRQIAKSSLKLQDLSSSRGQG